MNGVVSDGYKSAYEANHPNPSTYPSTPQHTDPHAATIAEALADLDEYEQRAVIEHVHRLAELSKAKREAVMTLVG